MFKNNKGFSLVEVLVTVGLIGVLTAIAVPAYNKYKDGTNLMAMKADLGNASKTYTAYDAVNDTFCASFSDVGFAANSGSPVWKRNAFIGFGAVDSGDCTVSLADAQYKSAAGGVGSITLNSTNCSTYGGSWDNSGNGVCDNAKLSAFEYKGSDPTACKLSANGFTMGASSEAAGTAIGGAPPTRLIQVKDGGAISETANANCN